MSGAETFFLIDTWHRELQVPRSGNEPFPSGLLWVVVSPPLQLLLTVRIEAGRRDIRV